MDAANETDASGLCLINYKWLDTYSFTKTKYGCVSSDLPIISNQQRLLETVVQSSISSHYTLDKSSNYFLKIVSKETHIFYPIVHKNIGGELIAEQILTLKETQSCERISANTLEEAISQIGDAVTQETLATEHSYAQEDQKQFSVAVNNFRDLLQPKSLGSLQSAKAFVHLVRVAKKSSKEDILKALGSKKNQPILLV